MLVKMLLPVLFSFCLALLSTYGQRIHWVWPRDGSIAGGSTVTIYGSGFTTDAYTHANLVFFGTIPCDVIWYTASSTRLECVTRPYPQAFEGFTSPYLQASIITNGVFYRSTQWYCRFRYHWGNTPQVRSIDPPAAPVNSLITIAGYNFRSNLYNNYQRLFAGDHICDPWNYDTNGYYSGRWRSGLYHVQCRVIEPSPGAWNISAVLTGYLGSSWNHSQVMVLGYDGKLSMFELFPDIHEVSPHFGSVNGGTLLTVKGTGFGALSAVVSVNINGLSCRIISHSPTEIQCWTEVPPVDSVLINDKNRQYPDTLLGNRFKGSRGVTYHHFSGINQLLFDSLELNNKFPDSPDRVAVFPSFSPKGNYNYNNYGARYMAFFTPVQNGTHTFFIRADDIGRLYFSEGQNISDLQLIASASSYTGWNGLTSDYSSRRSAPLELTAGKQYLLVGDVIEGGGGDFLRVGVLLHQTQFYHNETAQSIRERQEINITTDGLYDIQSISGSVNLSEVIYEEPPQFVLEWGDRTTVISLSSLQSNESVLPLSVLGLFEGVCHFEPSFGVHEFAVFTFETAIEEGTWSSWNGQQPELSKDEVLCGYSSLYLPDGRAMGFLHADPNKGFRTTDYPYLCMGYKIPPGVPASIALNVHGSGWKTITLINANGGDTDWDNGPNSDSIVDDDKWRFGCANIHKLLSFVNPGEISYEVLGFGFNSPIGSANQLRGFYIDHVSFLSEKTHLNNESYLTPTRPNGIAIHQLVNISSTNTTDNILTYSATLEIIPTDCQHIIPLIQFYPVNATVPGIISYGVERLQTASAPAQGTISFGFNSSFSNEIPITAEAFEIESALESIDGVNDTTVWRYNLPQDNLGKFCPGSRLLIEFQRNPGDLPLVTVNATNATGDGLAVTIEETSTGGLFLFPIPGHMLQTVEKRPQVTIKVNNQRAACSGGHGLYETQTTYTDSCSFSYDNTVTPNVTSLSSTVGTYGSSITIYGTGFSTEPDKNFVLFGDIECKVTACSSTFITCTLQHGQGGTDKPLWVHIIPVGVATTNSLSIDYNITLNIVSPSTSGLGGGIEAIITGSGFTSVLGDNRHIAYTYESQEHSLSYTCAAWSNRVYFDSSPATILFINSTTIRCIVPASESTGSSFIRVEVYCTDTGSMEIYDVSQAGLFTYDNSLTPSVLSIHPVSGSGQGGTSITISGSGFTTDTTVQFGDSPCVIDTITSSTLTCVTSPHTHGNVSVTVFVPERGLSTEYVKFSYELLVTSVSSCSGSIFGGHIIAITGMGFASVQGSMSVSMGSASCNIQSVSDTEIVCTTATSATTHIITNNAINPEYGLGYSWTPSNLSVSAGDSVRWSWTGSPFTPMKRLVQVDSSVSNVYNGYGFRSESQITGTFKYTFTEPGIYYYIMEGYGHIGFRGSIVVTAIASKPVILSVTAGTIPVSFAHDICGQTITENELPIYTYSIDNTPQLSSVSPQDVYQNDIITINVTGVADDEQYNILTIGGKPCISSDETSTNKTEPLVTEVSTGISYTDVSFECTVPDLNPGSYRIVLHSAGRGWAYSALNDSTINVRHAITSGPTPAAGSIYGGNILSIPIVGLDFNMIGHTTVTIGNTPCPIQVIESTGSNPQTANITCFTQPSINDGYSSLLERTALVYWTFQYDFYAGNGQYQGSESTNSFSSSQLNNIPAVAVGTVIVAEPGISNNNITDQSITLAASYIEISTFPEYSSLSSFMFEAWFKTEPTSDKHVILVSSYDYTDGDIVQGFMLMINPCFQFELWLAKGDSLSSASPELNDCSITDECPSDCSDRLIYKGNSSRQYDLPRGVWNKLVSQSLDLTSGWIHVVFGFQAKKSCNDAGCYGQQLLYVNSNKYSKSSTYRHSNTSSIIIGGTDSLPNGVDPDTIAETSLLYPYYGSVDELALYRQLLDTEIEDHYYYGTHKEQPIWIATEYTDGIGSGMVPQIDLSGLNPVFENIGLTIDWDTESHGQYTVAELAGIQFDWSSVHGIWQVTSAAFSSCAITKEELIKEWSPSQVEGSVHVWLQPGAVYYFIDPTGNNCLNGIKAKITVGNYTVINWQLGAHPDITLNEGNGLLFQWEGSVPHNVIEMTSQESVNEHCLYVGGSSQQLGKVAKEWYSTPSTSGSVAVSGLSVGNHYFVCSVGTHCQNGMRFTVTVVPNIMSAVSPDSEIGTVYTIPWVIQSYEPLTILHTDKLQFTWTAFHSLHQVTEEVYTSCDVSQAPLYEWGEPSVDRTVTIADISPGIYYFICSVSGHCDNGMKIKVTILPNIGIPVLTTPVLADCLTESGRCSYTYSIEDTPQLLENYPLQDTAGGSLIVRVANYNSGDTAVTNTVADALIWIGNSICTDVILTNITDTYTELMCTVPDLQTDTYPVDFQVISTGYAAVYSGPFPYGSLRNSSLPLTSYPTLLVTAQVFSISPSAGSLAGGLSVTINGSGFTNIVTDIDILLGDLPCNVTSATRNEIVCVTSAFSAATVDLHVRINGKPAYSNVPFTYRSDATPTITSITNGDGIRGGDIITIQGTNFNSTDVRVQILSTDEVFKYQITPQNECINAYGTDTSISCTVPSKSAGIYKVVVLVPGKGLSKEDSMGVSQVNYMLEVSAFTPNECGHGGGVILSITGVGFSNDAIVRVCKVNCAMKTTAVEELTCVLDHSVDIFGIDTDVSCPLSVFYNNRIAYANSNFTFNSSLTPSISSLAPTIGGTGGGTMLTILGSGFLPISLTDDLLPDDIVITIDTAICQWYNISTPNDTSITCRTSEHRTTIAARVTVFIKGKGSAVTSIGNALLYEYIDLWSSRYTWGSQDPPSAGDSVYIRPGQVVFLDIDTPVLNLILIEGSLIFQDNQDLHLQAKYIFINHGRLQVGTEEAPFQHKAIITLHGNVRDPEIPIYGAKVLGIRQGELDLHGIQRNITWTRLAQTALANSTSLQLQEPVDWVPGDNIVIASSGKDGNETETNTVDSVSDSGYLVNLVSPLNYDHYGVTETFEDDQFIEMRAEVGLLTHNVIIQGSLDQSNPFEGQGADQYGAQVFIHRAGPHPTPIRIEHTEVRFAGQAFRLGRYAIHFHLSGSMNGSYIRHCAIHHSNNRALTAHGVHDLLVEGNVAYDIKGHAFFVEDGVETNNKYYHNLGVFIRGSSSLLNTDQIPAVFWITNPNNIFIGNAAVASRAYGFWYDLDNFPSGPSRTNSVCPNKTPFGIFRNNVAHSCNEFGLRIWETYTPYVDGCGMTAHDIAVLSDFTSYANGIHGVELSVVGHVRLVQFKIADNRDNGIEIQETVGEWGGALVKDSLIVSHTSINAGSPGTGGIKTPNTPHLTVANVTFVNFDNSNTSCLRACSHCKLRQGGFQVWFSGLKFQGNSSLHKASFQWEHEVLYRDLDGSLSGNVDGWVAPNSDLYPDQYCIKSLPEFSLSFPGSVCTSDVYLLRLAWNRAQPEITLEDVAVNVTNQFGTSVIPWRHYRLTHMDGYMCTLPSTYNHMLTWILSTDRAIDTTSYSAGLYSMRPEDYVTLSHQFIQPPDHVSVGGNHFPLQDLPDPLQSTFSWYMDNETDTVTYIINGINRTDSLLDQSWTYTYEPCPVTGCPEPVDPDSGPLEENQRRWSQNSSWPSGRLPEEGEDVAIASSWRMLLDITPPPLNRVIIFGELQFEDERDYNFTANLILVRGSNAHLIIGTADSPFSHTAHITLTGRRDDRPLALANSMVLGSKAIGIFGNVTIYGQYHSHTWSRLYTTATQGSSNITLNGPDYPDWTIGDEIIIASSTFEPAEAEIRTIVSYNHATGSIQLNEPLQYDHTVHQLLSDEAISEWTSNSTNNWWGGNTDSLILAPEVGLLTHNIIIQGGEDPTEPLEEHHYGCRILIGQYRSSIGFTYTGHVVMDSVEIRYCGQGGYYSPHDPRYSIAFKNSIDTSTGSRITRSSIHHGYNTAIGVHVSNGVEISNNVIHRTTGSSIVVGGKNNAVYGNLALLTSTVQPNSPQDNHAVDFPATYDIDYGNTVRDNAAAGTARIAYRYTGDVCHEGRLPKLENEASFWNNTAHSGLTALVILGLPFDCASVAGLTASHHWDYTVFSSSASSVTVSHMKLAIGKVGFNLNIFGPNPVSHLIGRKSVSIYNSLLVGFLPSESCQTTPPSHVIPGVSFVASDQKLGIMMSSFNKKRSKMDGTGSWHLMKNYPTVDGQAIATNITFAQFNQPIGCGYEAFAIGNNPLSPDAVHPLQLSGIQKLRVPLNNSIFYYNPDVNWIVQEDCVDMDCDGPKHALVIDSDGSFAGTVGVVGSVVPYAELRFSNYSARTPISWLDHTGGSNGLATPEEVIEYKGIYRRNPTNDCSWMPSWNAYYCQGMKHRMLVIESMDSDTEVRRLSPVALVGGTNWTYTDLLNGPMDHGWCTYYTCLKRLSTFFTIVATDIDYHIWMTGSLPANMRLHLLNADNNDRIHLHIWYKNPQRKDIYRNGIFIEPLNTRYLDNGAVTQLDGYDFTLDTTDYSGANYFERSTQLLNLVLKGSDPIEIRTPPVVQISLDVAVSLDEFFLYNLIDNLAFVLNIDPSRIRVVEIVSEDISRKRRNLPNTNSTNRVTLEFGDPPVSNVTAPTVAPIENVWREGKGETDTVENEREFSGLVPSSNQFNEDMPITEEQFAEEYNDSVALYTTHLEAFKAALNATEQVNMLGDTVVELVQTSDSSIQNVSIVGISVVPASVPAQPTAPVIPPAFENITENANVTLAEVELPVTMSLRATRSAQIHFAIPSELIVSREPHTQTGHLVYVAVSMIDSNGNLVHNLGLLTSWTCTAELISSESNNQPLLGGVTEVPFVNGTAEFTRMRVDRPASNLTLSFTTRPGNFMANTSVSFTVIVPPATTNRTTLVLTLEGNIALLTILNEQIITDAIRSAIGQQLDIDVSRIQISFDFMNSQQFQVNVTLLDRMATDPHNVPTLSEALATLHSLVQNENLTINISGSYYTATDISTTAAPIIPTPEATPTQQPINFIDLLTVILSVAAVTSSLIIFMMLIACVCFCCDLHVRRKKKEESTRNTPVVPVNDDNMSETDSLLSFRLAPLPRARLSFPQNNMFSSHPNVPSDVEYPTNQTSLGSTDEDSSSNDRTFPRLPRVITQQDDTFPRLQRVVTETSVQRHAVPTTQQQSFGAIPRNMQRRQGHTLASFMNEQQAAGWDSPHF